MHPIRSCGRHACRWTTGDWWLGIGALADVKIRKGPKRTQFQALASVTTITIDRANERDEGEDHTADSKMAKTNPISVDCLIAAPRVGEHQDGAWQVCARFT